MTVKIDNVRWKRYGSDMVSADSDPEINPMNSRLEILYSPCKIAMEPAKLSFDLIKWCILAFSKWEMDQNVVTKLPQYLAEI